MLKHNLRRWSSAMRRDTPHVFLKKEVPMKSLLESEKDGVLVKEIQSKNLKPTDFSPLR